MGQSVTFAPNTKAGITWSNAPSESQFAIMTNKGVTVGGLSRGAVINSLSFDGSFHAQGTAFFWGVPLPSGFIDSQLNRDSGAVGSATDLANWLRNSNVTCEKAVSLITTFSTIAVGP